MIKQIFSMLGDTRFLAGAGALLSLIAAFRSQGESQRFERELREQAEEIAEATRQNSGQITGGDSFPFFDASLSDGPSPTVQFVMLVEGEFPLYDVRATLMDLTVQSEIMEQKNRSGHKVTYGDLDQARMSHQMGNVPPKHGAIFGAPLSLHPGKDLRLFFQTSARNGTFTQSVKIVERDGKWLVASQTRDFNKILKEEIPADFPRMPDGTINW